MSHYKRSLQTNLKSSPKLSPNLLSSLQIALIDGANQPLLLLKQTLENEHYVRTFNTIDEISYFLSSIDLLIVDISIAIQPKSTKLVRAKKILILSHQADDELPPWFKAQHIFLLPCPKNSEEIISQLTEYITTSTPSFDTLSSNPEHLTLLFGINQTLNRHFLNINDLFERVLTLTYYLEAHFSALLLIENEEISYYRSTQPGQEELTGLAGRRFAQRLLNDGIEGWVLDHNQPTILENTRLDSRWFRAAYLPEQEYCIVAIPITLARVEARGVYLIGHSEPSYFNERDLSLFTAVTNQIAMAIENALLFKNQSERSIQLALINQVGQAATSILNLDAMLRMVVQAIRRSFSFFKVSIHLFNENTRLVEQRASTEIETEQLRKANPVHQLQQGLIGWAFATNQTILANDVAQDPRYIFDQNNREVRSELCVPIVMGTKAIGVLDLQSTQLEAFDKYHVSALETLGDQLAIAIENARLYDTNNQHIQELKSLNQIGQAITSTLDLKKTLTVITNETTRLMNVAAASVALRDDETSEIWFAAASGEGADYILNVRLPLGQGIAGWVAEKGQPVVVPNVEMDNRFFADIDKGSGFHTESILCVPLQTKGRTIGVLEVLNKKSGSFNQEDLTLLQSIAIPAATAIENAQLYESQTRTIRRLEQTQHQLVQSGKLAAVGELAAGVAHEINNPLTTIIALTSLLNSTTKIDTKYKEDLELIYSEAHRAHSIVHNLLNFARTDNPRRFPVDINSLIEDAISLVYTQTISPYIKLERTFSKLDPILLDVNQIKQVFVNLMNNAIQAMMNTPEKPGTLTISTRQDVEIHEETQGTHFIKKQSKEYLLCQIKDTGPGIAIENLDKIFDPFFTTKEVGQGTGLGLSISYNIVKQHDGELLVDSTPGQGTTFTIKIPIIQDVNHK